MNFRRGFQRLYLVFVLVWIAGVFVVVFSGRSMPPWIDGLAIVRSETLGGSDYPLSGWSPAVWVWAAGLLFIPPVVGYVALFYVWPWIASGFKSESTDN
jgi:hypothetical protein